MKRFISMLLAGMLCVGALAGCGASSRDDTPVVMTVDGEEIQSSELAAYIVYNMMYYQSYFQMDASALADETIFGSMKDGCRDQVVQYRAIKKLADQEGVSLSNESKDTLKENKNTNRETMGSETGTFTRWLKYSVKGDTDPFVTYLNSYGYTEELYDTNTETMQLESDLIEKYYNDGIIAEQFNNTYLHAKSILISDQDADGNLLTGDAFDEAQEKAEDILEEVKNGGDFDTLWKDNNSDTAQGEDGYYFTQGDMIEEYYTAVNEMEVGTVNDELVYYEGYGWFIIQKRELSEDAITNPSSYLNNSGEEDDDSCIKDAIGQTVVSEKLNEVIETMDVQTNEEYDKITAYNVNAYLPFATDALVAGGSGSAAGSAAAGSAA